MFLKNEVEEIINRNISFIQARPILMLESAILKHYEQVSTLYKKNPLLYKTIFKSHRFNLISLIATEYYMNEESTFSDVYTRFLPLNLMSKNSVSAFFSFLVVTGRLKISTYPKDKRKVAYELTNKFKSEAFMLINTMTNPVCKLFGVEEHSRMSVNDFLTCFLSNFSKLIYTNNFNFDSVEKADVFINKDAGHTILLNLYCNRVQFTNDTYKSLNVKELCTICGVSRSHIKKILATAGELNLVSNPSAEGNIILNHSFISLVRSYMTRYFSLCYIGLGTR
ncbi:hypothetical protein AAFN90_13955 [Erwiniaceae bacterium CAU 1747]